MKGIEYLIGSEDINVSPLNAYSDEAILFISDLSAKIMKSSIIRKYTDIAALGFWGRKGNIQKLKEGCPESNLRLGRGLCFHIAPSNIPMNFVFSYMFGILAGCSNIVRLPSRNYTQVDVLIELIKDTLEYHPEIESRSSFIRYKADNEITKKLSMHADVRMIWGGDQTVKKIRSLESRPKCIDIVFPDRYSICIIDGDIILNTDKRRINRLAEEFYNDTYLMDQNACSSPMVICWLNDSNSAREKFWDSVFKVAETKYNLQAEIGVDKYTKSFEDIIDKKDNIVRIIKKTNLLYRAEIKELVTGLERYRGNCGYFYEYSMKSIEDIIPVITEKYQTVTYFGVDAEDIRSIVLKNKLTGIDRIVPIGKAMDISVIWDGYDLVRMMSRIIKTE